MAYNLATAYVPIVPSMDGVGKAIENGIGGNWRKSAPTT